MGQFSQAGRPLTIKTELEGDPFLLIGLQGHEGVSDLFQFDLDLRAEADADIPVEALIGHPAAVTVTGAGGIVRHIHGLIRELTRADQDDDFDHYHAQLVPRFWLWSRRVQSRVAYFLLTGLTPFRRDTIENTIAARLSDAVPPLLDVCPAADVDLNAVIVQCLERDPTARFPDIDQLANALAQCSCANRWTPANAASWWRLNVPDLMPCGTPDMAR